MCTLVLWAGADKPGEFSYSFGDCLSVVDDGHVLGSKDVASPDYAFIFMPGVPRKQMAYLLEEETVEANHSGELDTKVVRRRRMRLTLIDKTADKDEALGQFTAPTKTESEVVAAEETKPPLGRV